MILSKVYSKFQASKGVFTDSRKIIDQGLFFALKGPHFDGNQYALKTLELGAIAAVVDDPKVAEKHPNCILVEDSISCLQQLAQMHRRKLQTTIIGLTGSNGKTTSKELIYSVLSQKFKTHATQGNLNNHIGVPLTLLQIEPDCEIAIIEMGANHKGEIRELAAIAEPDLGYITNFGYAHIEGFGSLEGVVQGKSELYQDVQSRSGTIVINGDDTKQVALMENYPCLSYGTQPHNDIVLEYLTHTQKPIELRYQDTIYSSQLHGDYNGPNLGIAFALGVHFELNLSQIAQGILDYTPNNQRSEWKTVGENRVFLDAYNANPSSMRAALKSFASNHPNGIVVLGDMYELGDISEASHLEIAQQAIALGFKKIILVGSHFGQLKRKKASLHLCSDAAAVRHLWETEDWKNEVILIKGSRGMTLEKIIEP